MASSKTTAPRSTTPALTILDAVHDPHLFRAWFEPLGSWAAWFVVLKALFGLAMTPSEREIFQRFTGRSTAPTYPAREAWLIVGRRGGEVQNRGADRRLRRGVQGLPLDPGPR
jgi:hypothetical protein